MTPSEGRSGLAKGWSDLLCFPVRLRTPRDEGVLGSSGVGDRTLPPRPGSPPCLSTESVLNRLSTVDRGGGGPTVDLTLSLCDVSVGEGDPIKSNRRDFRLTLPLVPTRL